MYFLTMVKSIKSKVKHYIQHLKDCFTVVTPSETNYHFNPSRQRYQCLDCEKVFTYAANVGNCCPHCASTSYGQVNTHYHKKLISSMA